MIGKGSRKVITVNVLYAIKEKIYLAYISKQLKLWETNYSFNDSKRKSMALYCTKKSINIKRNSVKTR